MLCYYGYSIHLFKTTYKKAVWNSSKVKSRETPDYKSVFGYKEAHILINPAPFSYIKQQKIPTAAAMEILRVILL
jgi:hypothetical protein